MRPHERGLENAPARKKAETMFLHDKGLDK
jgi:hypothetical protein